MVVVWSWNFRTREWPNSVVVVWSWSLSGPVTPGPSVSKGTHFICDFLTRFVRLQTGRARCWWRHRARNWTGRVRAAPPPEPHVSTRAKRASHGAEATCSARAWSTGRGPGSRSTAPAERVWRGRTRHSGRPRAKVRQFCLAVKKTKQNNNNNVMRKPQPMDVRLNPNILLWRQALLVWAQIKCIVCFLCPPNAPFLWLTDSYLRLQAPRTAEAFRRSSRVSRPAAPPSCWSSSSS